jgi:hypothetical protein
LLANTERFITGFGRLFRDTVFGRPGNTGRTEEGAGEAVDFRRHKSAAASILLA